MVTRAGSATAALRAKQNLVRLLLQQGDGTMIPTTTNRFMDSLSSKPTIEVTTAAVYSYYDLRTAYLQKVQELHPDKHYSTSGALPTSSPSQKSLFLKVQEAWKLYESFAKNSNQCLSSSSSGHNTPRNATTNTTNNEHQTVLNDANFTMFGVGCSFADNDQERQYRNYIMDQASRGYFTTGEISDGCHDVNDPVGKKKSQHWQNQTAEIKTTGCDNNETNFFRRSRKEATGTIAICNDDLFDASPMILQHETTTTKTTSSLVSHLIPPHRRRTHSTAIKKGL